MLESNNQCCFSKILKLIEKLQENTSSSDCIDNTCSRPFLGIPLNIECYNTRPVTFYGCDNNLFTVDYSVVVDGTTLTGTSSIFRVEKVEGCCVTVTILIPNPDTTATNRPYITTNQTVTINLDCICAIKCLGDTIVDL